MAGFVAVAAGAVMPGVASSISAIFSRVGSVMEIASTQRIQLPPDVELEGVLHSVARSPPSPSQTIEMPGTPTGAGIR